jgi:hypothetical protein
MMKKISIKIQKNKKLKKDQDVILKFLKQTKEGKYAVVEKSSLKYTRIQDELPETNEEIYYYSLS